MLGLEELHPECYSLYPQAAWVGSCLSRAPVYLDGVQVRIFTDLPDRWYAPVVRSE